MPRNKLLIRHIPRPHFPDNCFNIDISRHVQNTPIRTITFIFGALLEFGISILLEDRKVSSKRLIQENNGFFSGDKIVLKQGKRGSGVKRAYSIEFRQNIFIEEDASKNCRNYPNKEFKSYSECDYDFVRTYLRGAFKIKKRQNFF